MSADQFATFDAAYVLGALSDTDRIAYEAHLAECDECATSVRQLRGLPSMLATVSPAALHDETPPASLLPALQFRVRRERRRRRWIAGGIAAAVAACLIAVTVAVTRPDHPVHHPVAMSVVRNAPIAATAEVRSVDWGTQIALVCRYYESVTAGRSYALVVVDRTGVSQRLGTWTLTPGKVARYNSGTSLPRDQIAAVQITSMNGTPLLSLKL
jgi:hypothetical protein